MLVIIDDTNIKNLELEYEISNKHLCTHTSQEIAPWCLLQERADHSEALMLRGVGTWSFHSYWPVIAWEPADVDLTRKNIICSKKK